MTSSWGGPVSRTNGYGPFPSGRATALGFDPLRTRPVFPDRLSRSERARFGARVGAALGAHPSPEPPDDPRLERLHRIWTEARRRAFERFVATLDDAE